MKRIEIISALVGLTGAVQNHGKTECSDTILQSALQLYSLLPDTEDTETDAAVREAVQLIHNEKNAAAPGCATCASPCGGTSDYDLDKLKQAAPEVRELKLELVQLLGGPVSEKNLDLCRKGIMWFAWSDEPVQLRELLAEVRQYSVSE